MIPPNQAADRKPLREGLMQLQPARLIGSRCESCGTVVFPVRDFCPHCLADGPHPQVPLSPEGTVFSYTVVRQAPAGRKTPYVLAYVDLPEQVRVLSLVDVDPGEIRIGMPVRLVLTDVDGPDGEQRIHFAFQGAREQEGASA